MCHCVLLFAFNLKWLVFSGIEEEGVDFPFSNEIKITENQTRDLFLLDNDEMFLSLKNLFGGLFGAF